MAVYVGVYVGGLCMSAPRTPPSDAAALSGIVPTARLGLESQARAASPHAHTRTQFLGDRVVNPVYFVATTPAVGALAGAGAPTGAAAAAAAAASSAITFSLARVCASLPPLSAA